MSTALKAAKREKDRVAEASRRRLRERIEGPPPKLDFLGDWTRFQREQLQVMGYDPPVGAHHEVSFAYFNVLRRLIEPRPRELLQAPELVCPPDLEEGFDLLKHKIERGHDLRPHLSRSIQELDFNDYMLNDWGVHHLHLGRELDRRGFVGRTKPVLFARFCGDHAYLVGIHEHGRDKPEVWAKQEVLNVIERNWPHLFDPYELEIEADSIDERARLGWRRVGATVVSKVGDRVLMPPGGGYMQGKLSMRVVRIAADCLNRITELEKRTREDLRKVAARNGVMLPRHIEAKLIATPEHEVSIRVLGFPQVYKVGYLPRR